MPVSRYRENDDLWATRHTNSVGHLHREDGPAIIREYDDGTYTEAWFYESELHRYDGPCATSYKGSHIYFVHGSDKTPIVDAWLEERDYTWDTMTDQEKWELEMFIRSL